MHEMMLKKPVMLYGSYVLWKEMETNTPIGGGKVTRFVRCKYVD
jgi:hypothetical protein